MYTNSYILIKSNQIISKPKSKLMTWVQSLSLVPFRTIYFFIFGVFFFPTEDSGHCYRLDLHINDMPQYLHFPNIYHTNVSSLQNYYHFIIIFNYVSSIFHALNIPNWGSKFTQSVYPVPGSCLVSFISCYS